MPNDSLIAQIRARIDFESFFQEFVELRGRGAERTALCIFHQNTDTPALGINVQTGVYICRNPDCGARGDFLDFYMRVRSVDFRAAVGEIARQLGIIQTDPPEAAHNPDLLPESNATSAHGRLMATESALAFLQERRGLTPETIQAWGLGYDGDRYTIPIRDELGRLVNLRKYKPNAVRSQDKMLNVRGHGTARLWPLENVERARLSGAPLYLMEGEMDCLLAIQCGLLAVTTTGGAGTWRDEWNRYFTNRDLVICYDNDEAGRRGALNIAHRLAPVARRIRIATIPLAEPPGADFTDFIVGHGHALTDFLALAEAAVPFDPSPEAPNAEAEEPPIDLHLSQASRAEYNNKAIRIQIMLSGKATAPYIVPNTVALSCSMPGLPMCSGCPVAAGGGHARRAMDFQSNELLEFLKIKDDELDRKLKRKTGVPTRCSYVTAETVESLNVEELRLIPEVDHTNMAADRMYVTRKAYYVGHGLRPNNYYTMTGRTVPDPRDQLATHLLTRAIEAQSSLDVWQPSDDLVRRLAIFRPTEPGVAGLWRRLEEMYADVERVTRIYERRDVMLAVDLIYHSVLRFRLQGQLLARGWGEALILGDTRTGKTTIVKAMLEHYKAGEFGTGENTSLAGLVGGLQQMGDTWLLQWGKIPLNDRGLFVVDEAGNLPQEQIARMSSMRSSGIAEIIKVHTERTESRTRQIWISNPRGNRPLGSYGHGVLAVKELIGAPEDIARFDVVVTAASRDVALNVVNASRVEQEPVFMHSDLCHQRVMWAWSRMPDHVIWQAGAEDTVLRHAMRHGERYRFANEIPLVEPNEQRVKIARLAVAAACLFFSSDEDGEAVHVKPEHVEFAVQFLDQSYAKPSLNYDAYARANQRANVLRREDAILTAIEQNPDAVELLMSQERFAQRDIGEILAIDNRESLRGTLTMLRNNGFLRSYGGFYYKTPAAITFLQQQQSGMGQSNGNGNGNGHGHAPPDLEPMAPRPSPRRISNENDPDRAYGHEETPNF